MHAIACILRTMKNDLLSEIEDFMRAESIGEHRFGILAANNGRLVERLRTGGRVWPETESQIRDYIASRKTARPTSPNPEEAA